MITNRNGYHRYQYHDPCHYHYYCYCNRNVARTRRGEGFLFTRNSSPCTPHPTLFTLHPATYTLNPNHTTLNQTLGGGQPLCRGLRTRREAVCRHNVPSVDIEGYLAHNKTPPPPDHHRARGLGLSYGFAVSYTRGSPVFGRGLPQNFRYMALAK